MGSFELALFESDESGAVRLVGRLRDAELICAARDRILAERRAEVARLDRDGDGPRLRAVREEPDDGG